MDAVVLKDSIFLHENGESVCTAFCEVNAIYGSALVVANMKLPRDDAAKEHNASF